VTTRSNQANTASNALAPLPDTAQTAVQTVVQNDAAPNTTAAGEDATIAAADTTASGGDAATTDGSLKSETQTDGSTSEEGDAAGTEAEEADVPDYDNTGTAFTILLDDKATVSVNIDELDIAAVKTGQESEVELDAIENTTFSGIVTDVADTAITDSGVANYTAVVTIDKDAAMLEGMSATVTIIKEKKSNVLTIPLEAVQEYGDSVFVYTSADEEGTLGGQVEIETGLSNGTTVEVVSGLTEGQTVYYILSASTDSDAAFGGMAMRGGGMPIGGAANVTIRQDGGGGPPSERTGG
jgi:multidrug efflux pump subunit AcrA (membrane-fusion protein)